MSHIIKPPVACRICEKKQRKKNCVTLSILEVKALTLPPPVPSELNQTGGMPAVPSSNIKVVDWVGQVIVYDLFHNGLACSLLIYRGFFEYCPTL